MATYAGGTQVKRGYYIDGTAFEFTNVERDGGVLPGTVERRWLRVPTVAVIAAAPALGGLFVLSFPLIGFGVVAYALVKKLIPAARAGARELGATLGPTWAPGEAHLTGEAGEEAPPAGAPAVPREAGAAELDRLAATIDAARKPRE
jgi:hypothetical protein